MPTYSAAPAPAPAPAPEPTPTSLEPSQTTEDPHAAERSFLALDRDIIEDVLSDILRAAARRHGVEV